MACKLDQQRIKQQLFHLSISLASVLICMSYLQYRNSWANVGKLWEPLVLPTVITAEILKVALSRYYGQQELYSQKLRQRSFTSFVPKKILGSLLVQILSVALYAFICIVLGASIQDLEQTFVLALLLTLTTVSPAVFLLGGSGTLQFCFCEKPQYITKSAETALDLFKYNAAGAIFGAWTGSIVAPLDWDREWQVYPIPNVVGVLLGIALANIYACWRVLYTTVTIYFTKRCI